MNRPFSRPPRAAALILFLTLGLSGVSFGQSLSPNALQPAGTPNGKRILFDNTHGETAGMADWVIDGGMADFAQGLADQGYLVSELRLNRDLTLADLKAWDVVVFPESNNPFKAGEQQAILDYVTQGGSVFFIADHYNSDRNLNRWCSNEVFNGYRRGAFGDPVKGMSRGETGSQAMQGVTSTDWLGSNFGIRFRTNAIGNVGATDVVAPDQAFGITAHVKAVAMHDGSTLAIVDPAKAKGLVYLPPTQDRSKFSMDQGVYDGGGRAEGPFAAVAKVGLGKAGFLGDSSPAESSRPRYKREDTGKTKKTWDGWYEVSDAAFLTQMVGWLARHEAYTSLTQVPGLNLDSPTVLLADEEPSRSTNPHPDPWTTPAPGYLWYDQRTFAPGAYTYLNGAETGQPEEFNR